VDKCELNHLRTCYGYYRLIQMAGIDQLPISLLLLLIMYRLNNEYYTLKDVHNQVAIAK